jgi:hypothetical protein
MSFGQYQRRPLLGSFRWRDKFVHRHKSKKCDTRGATIGEFPWSEKCRLKTPSSCDEEPDMTMSVRGFRSGYNKDCPQVKLWEGCGGCMERVVQHGKCFRECYRYISEDLKCVEGGWVGGMRSLLWHRQLQDSIQMFKY